MSAHLTRAQLLLAQSRPADAEQEAQRALAASPDDTAALALLALSRSAQKKGPAAIEAAQTAVGLAPDNAYLHYVHGVTLHHADRADAARSAVNESLRLNPNDADTFALLASIELTRGDSAAALTAADQALALDPEDVSAANLRAMALVRLGRKAEATLTVDFALHRAAENALSHANQGWNYLHRNDPKRAQEFFREALRLDPDLDYARQGMLEALKARNPIYRGMLAYFLWIGRQGSRFQWAFVIGTYFVSRLVSQSLRISGPLGWVAVGFALLFYTFVYLSWTAVPMFNLLLRLDRFGRYVLSPEEKRGTTWFGSVVLLTLVFLIAWPLGAGAPALWSGILCAALSICVSAVFSRTGRARWILGASAGALALIAVVAATAIWRDPESSSAGAATLSLFFMGFLGFQFLANFVGRR